MFAAVRYHQKFLTLRPADYEICKDFGKVHTAPASRAPTSKGRANMKGERRVTRQTRSSSPSKPRKAALSSEDNSRKRKTSDRSSPQRGTSDSSTGIDYNGFVIHKDLLYIRDPSGYERLCVPDTSSRDGANSTPRLRLIGILGTSTATVLQPNVCLP